MAKAKTKYAGFWLRFLAYVIDMIIFNLASLIMIVLLALIFGLLLRLAGVTDKNSPLVLAVAAIIMICFFLGPWLYYALMESSKNQATVGKLALGLKVTDEKGKRISFGRASGRFFAKILSSIILGIGFLMIAFTEKKQGLHDEIAGCLVVKE